jgi:rhamnose utilization protein RhaD (predicted bifunctional aldolase and dehydrogenase)
MSLEKLIAASNRYGADKTYVIAGGGNTSWKTDDFMYVKGSGTELANIRAEGFVKVNLQKLDLIWKKKYSEDSDSREEEVLADLMASRFPGEKEKRPSVETLLHALLPYPYVIHTHPALVNGLTCSKNGEKLVKILFGDQSLWVPVTNPGYILAKEVKEAIDKHLKGGRPFPVMIFLQNHGVFVPGNSIEEIDSLYRIIFEKIQGEVKKNPDHEFNSLKGDKISSVISIVKETLGTDMNVLGFYNDDILEMSVTEEAFKPLRLAMTPDHIVYYGFKPLFVENIESLSEALKFYLKDYDVFPRLVVIRGLGALAINKSIPLAEKARELFLDDVKVAVYTGSFGGFQFMPMEKIDFIRNWEVEKYRFSQSK